jgi:hypothetical protein
MAVSLLVAACAQTGIPDELAGESSTDDGVDGKADGAADGTYTYFSIDADLRKCLSPVCGGFFLARLNRSTTICADGHAAASCYTPTLDWSESRLSDDLQHKLVDAANTGASAAGVRAIVRGRFAAKTYAGHGNMGKFVVTEAWVAETDAVSDGVFAKVVSSHIECITTPCPTLKEKGLNQSRTANIAAIDWSFAGLTDREVQGFEDEILTPHGTIVAGDRYAVGHEKGRTATAAYHMLVDTGPCFVGGCSGQVCSDIDGVITTCEWEPQYACYHDATCARQSDGSCGWTPTADLQACLAQF